MKLSESLEHLDDVMGTMKDIHGENYTKLVGHAASIKALLAAVPVPDDFSIVLSHIITRMTVDLADAYKIDFSDEKLQTQFTTDIDTLVEFLIVR